MHSKEGMTYESVIIEYKKSNIYCKNSDFCVNEFKITGKKFSIVYRLFNKQNRIEKKSFQIFKRVYEMYKSMLRELLGACPNYGNIIYLNYYHSDH